MRRSLSAIILAALGGSSALAADPAYLDDRSSPDALVRSLYNAISRKEYARAWSYFDEKPSESLGSFSEGYADTDSVIVRTGLAGEEGAAGSTFYSLPVAIQAFTADGAWEIYGGCYDMRLANPQLQAEDFAPLHILRGKLEVNSGTIDEALPESCGDAAQPQPSEVRQARAEALYRGSFAESCLMLRDGSEIAPESWEIPYSYAGDRDGDPQRYAWLYRFGCNSGAYNESHVFVIANDYDELSVASFATPELDIRYSDEEQKKVDAIYVKGATAQTEVVNSSFDPATLTLSSHALWRGLGDASAAGKWEFREGKFSLSRYDVDASFDEEINAETVVDYHGSP